MAIGPLMSEGLRRLDEERSEAAPKREKKVAAGLGWQRHRSTFGRLDLSRTKMISGYLAASRGN